MLANTSLYWSFRWFGLGLLAFGGCCVHICIYSSRQQIRNRLEAAISQESQKYSARSPASRWELNLTEETYTKTNFNHETWQTMEETYTNYSYNVRYIMKKISHAFFSLYSSLVFYKCLKTAKIM